VVIRKRLHIINLEEVRKITRVYVRKSALSPVNRRVIMEQRTPFDTSSLLKSVYYFRIN
jgi:hypothetical protein